jgi:putative flippase GtrA
MTGYTQSVLHLFDRTFFKFILVGIINTLIGTGIMFSLYNLFGFSYWFSSASNYIITSILSFFLNKYFTFNVKRWSVRMVISFILTIVMSYLLAYGIAKPVVYHILANHSQKFRDNTAMLAGMILFTGLNYIGQRFVAFRREK